MSVVRLVSFEGLPSLLRDIVTRQVCGGSAPSSAASLAAPAKDIFAVRVLHMLEQLRAVAERHREVVYASTSWLDKVPTDDDGQAALYDALLDSACERLGISRRDGRHHAVCLHVDLHETFEELLELGADARAVGIADLAALDRRIRGEEVTHTVFPVTYHHIPVGRFAADCVEDVEAVVARAARLVAEAST